MVYRLHLTGDEVPMLITRFNTRQRRRYRVTLGSLPSFTVDVCAGGFCMELDQGHVLPPGMPVWGSIYVNDKPLAFSGYVAWAKRGNFLLKMPGRMGVRFTRVNSEFAQLAQLGSAKPPLLHLV